MAKRARSSAALATANHWAKRPKTGTSDEPIEISDDLENELIEEVAQYKNSSTFKSTSKSPNHAYASENVKKEHVLAVAKSDNPHPVLDVDGRPHAVIGIDSESGSSSPIKETLGGSLGDGMWPSKMSLVRMEKTKRSPQGPFSSPIRLIANHSNRLSGSTEEFNTDCVEIEDLIGASDLSLTFQFNFSVEVDFFLQYLHPNVARDLRRVTFVTGSPLLHTASDKSLNRFSLHEVVADISNRYGSHHTKMMVNFFVDGSCEVVVMTSNLTQLDFAALTQMCWRSGRLAKGKTTTVTGTRFQQDLTHYLRRYKRGPLDTLAKVLEGYDCLSVEIELVASTPGYFDLKETTDKSEIYGYGKLFQVLRRNNLLLDNTQDNRHHRVLAQVSSMAYPFALQGSKTASIFTHLLCPLIFGKSSFRLLEPGDELCRTHQHDNDYTPSIVFPSVADITKSTFGFVTAAAIHFKYTGFGPVRNQYVQNIRPYLCRWLSSGNATGRENVTPHLKIYACDNGDNWKSLKWVLVGSHNLSKQAWGGSKSQKFIHSDPSVYELSSYELSVFIQPREASKLVPVYGRDTLEKSNDTPIRFPFRLPPVHYSHSDRAWSNHVELDSEIKDSLGNSFGS